MYNLLPYSTKLLKDKTFAVRSQCEYLWKTFAFVTKQHPQVHKNFEICGKTFAVQAKTTKSTKVLAFKHFLVYGKFYTTRKF